MSAARLAALALSLAACVAPAPLEGAACDSDHPCPGRLRCLGGTCQAVPERAMNRCLDDNDCAVGVCLVSAGFCVQCVRDGDCGGLSACLPGAHVCGCASGSDCASGRCDAARGVCVGCFADAQCAPLECDTTRGVCAAHSQDGGQP